jgi:NAD(P)-dependent dehydrogenase (short-subunit alcohol dehydrogenase family)
MDIKDKVVVITGAGAGIGKATAELFAKKGAKVVCNSLSKSALKVVNDLKAQGFDALFVQGDVSREEDAKTIIDSTIDTYGKINILFNNAGIVIPGAVDTISTEDWERTMNVNVKGIYLVSKYAMSHLIATKGVIVNNSSSVTFKGVKDRAAYTASKGAVLSLTRAMAADYIDDGVRVNVICPGTTDTPSLANRLQQFEDPEQARKDFVARQKMGRLGKPEEIAQGVLLLATNGFTTGTSLSIDGGMTM